MRARTRWVALSILAGLAAPAACSGSPSGGGQASAPAGGDASTPPNSEPSGPPALTGISWTHKASAPISPWETNLAWDPRTGHVVNHGGHVFGHYQQSSYTYDYDLDADTWTLSLAPVRPQRRCLVDLAYIGPLERVLTGNGASSHGSLPQGGPTSDFKAIQMSDAKGPWLYDAVRDVWEDSRMLTTQWARTPHHQLAYDGLHDAVVYLAGDSLGLYAPRVNAMVYRNLPPALQGRSSYGIAADSRTGKVYVFGGFGPTPYLGTTDPAGAYDQVVHDDTWVYDVGADQWQDASSSVRPPKGMPGADFLKLNLALHEATGELVLFTAGTSRYVATFDAWPAAQAWAFDPDTLAWRQLRMSGEVPGYPGIVAVDQAKSTLVLLGGSLDGQPAGQGRPAVSRDVYTGTIAFGGARATVPTDLTATFAAPGAVTLAWKDDGAAAGAQWEVWRAPVDVVAGAYDRIGTASSTTYRDPIPGTAAHAYRVVRAGSPFAAGSLAAFSSPVRPGGLVASVDSARQVTLKWAANSEPDLTAYRLYRSKGGASGQLLATVTAPATSYVDTTDDLSDGLLRSYWVVAVNRGGVPSGASPLAWSAPEAPLDFQVTTDAANTRAAVAWTWPSDRAVAGFSVYVNDHHENTLDYTPAQYAAWWAEWKPLSTTPVQGHVVAFPIPDSTKSYVFYARAVNVLGQPGFYTDIGSGTNAAFFNAAP